MKLIDKMVVCIDNGGFDKIMLCVGTGTILTLLERLFGSFDKSFAFLCLVMFLDFITGLMCGASKGELSSQICVNGLFKKLFIFIYVIVGHHMDVLLGVNYVRIGICYMYATGEVLSIIENGIALGVPVPAPIKKALEMLNGGEDNEN